MAEVTLAVKYTQYNTIEELPDNYKSLITQAYHAMSTSYAPYSKFNVGACLLLEDDSIVQGSNQENASYPIGLCAERTAISAKVAIASNKKIKAIAIVANNENNNVELPIAPCGICRQVLLETELAQEEDIMVILHGNNGSTYVFKSIKELLPLHFDSKHL